MMPFTCNQSSDSTITTLHLFWWSKQKLIFYLHLWYICEIQSVRTRSSENDGSLLHVRHILLIFQVNLQQHTPDAAT